MDHARRSRPSGLPAELTSFVGRRAELREVKRLLGTARLLTLTGSGGAGKTRLALRAAAEMARGFPGGAWLVSLAPVRDPLLVTQAVFGALGVHDLSAGLSLSSLTEYLAGKRLLLVLDNCEHLLDACAVLAATLLKACPELRLLATSRQAMGVAGEVRMVVPPMSLPEVGAEISVEQVLTSDAVWLLSERAAAVVPGFAVDVSNAAGALELCRRLDGIPLALELAAVRLGSLSLGLGILLETLAWLAAQKAIHERAAVLLGFAQRVRERSTLTLVGPFRPQHAQSVTCATEGLGQTAFDAAFEHGRAMTIDEGVAFAVEGRQPPRAAPSALSRPQAVLTRRQLDIARLIADDLSNKQIAARLFLSERTVETHITNILNKLGLNSRSQINRWITDLDQPRLTAAGKRP
jgi:DNA-binding CsgD family transcriptional regulator